LDFYELLRVGDIAYEVRSTRLTMPFPTLLAASNATDGVPGAEIWKVEIGFMEFGSERLVGRNAEVNC